MKAYLFGTRKGHLRFGMIKDNHVVSRLMKYYENKTNSVWMLSKKMEYFGCSYSGKEFEYEQRWKKIKKKYDKIIIQKICVDAIGEYLLRYYAMVNNEKNENDKILYVRLPILHSYGERIANRFAMKYIGVEEDIWFWGYILENHTEELDTSEMELYDKRSKFPAYLIEAGSLSHHFTPKELQQGIELISDMKLKTPYVCFAARNSLYNEKTLLKRTDMDYSYRNASFDVYLPSIRYLCSMGIMSVKMGREEEPQDSKEYIDYAGKWSNDFGDLFLASQCEFFITGDSGIFTLPMLFSKPVLMVNAIPVTFGRGCVRYTEYDMFIPKKMFWKSTGKILSFREMLEIEKKIGISTKFYASQGVEIVDNTEDEILDATVEMFERLSGNWVDTKEDIDNYEKYNVIFNEMKEIQCNNSENWLGQPIPYRPAATFLRKYNILLE